MRRSFLFVVFVVVLFACSKKTQQENSITVTIEPQRYFAEQLVDTFFQIECMVPAGVSPETYDPAPAQMVKLARAKAYFCIGHIGFEEVWIDKLKQNYPQMQFFDNSLGASLIVSGHHHCHEHHAHGEKGIDPHLWNSPKEARRIVQNMYSALVSIDPANEKSYAGRLQQALEEIENTDEKIRALLKNSSQKAFIIYHPALTYFARDYGLTQYCIEADGKEPSPEQLKTLIETAREKAIRTVFIQQEFDRKNAALVAKETGCRLITINPLAYHWSDEMIRIAEALSNE
jgi:zinc transport system substrate-binding protein